MVSRLAVGGRRVIDRTVGAAIYFMPLTALLMVLMLIAVFYHAALGLQVIIEDYIHSAAKLPAILLIRFACFGLAAAGILAVLRIALGSP